MSELNISKIPAWALCYIVNDDPSALEDEDIKAVDDFYRENNIRSISVLDYDQDPYFTHHPAFGLACNVVDCAVEYRN